MMGGMEDDLLGRDNARNLSRKAVDNILEMLDLADFQPHQSPRFLGLAVGEANAELDLANVFNASHITLVDRKMPDVDVRDNMEVMESDVFDFLKTKVGEPFDCVTLLGAEYVVDTEQKLSQFLQLLSPNLSDGALVIVDPLEKRNIGSKITTSEALSEIGFHKLVQTTGSLYLVFHQTDTNVR